MDNLGTTEQFAVDSLIKAVEDCKNNVIRMATYLDDIDTDVLSELIQDPKYKEHITLLIPQLQKLAENLGMAQMVPLIASAILRKKD